MPSTAAPRPRVASSMPLALRLVLTLAVPFVAALTVTGTYLGKELLVAAAFVALVTIGFLFSRPMVGIAVMTAGFMLAAYPIVGTSLGLLTVNNLLGVGFVILLVAHVLETRDLSFLKVRPVVILALIGLVFLIASLHADMIFPLLKVSRGKRMELDKTEEMAHDLLTRLALLIFLWVFVRSRKDVRTLHLTFMFSLFLAVPSALWNWANGTLMSGFRAAASVTSGANPNRLAMICLIQVACWWFWARWTPSRLRQGIALAAIGASVLVVLASGSRSGLLGCGVLLLLLQTGPRQYRVPIGQVGLISLLAIISVAFLVPPESIERMLNFAPERHTHGWHSTLQREETVWLGLRMVADHPLLGVGLGNFREVARQVYLDPYFRPPHNSYLWAISEGGILGIAGYVILLGTTWLDIRVVQRLAARDPEMGHIGAALRGAFGIFCFFSLFADIWLNPITYLLIGQIVTLRRYMESLPAQAAIVPVRALRRTGPQVTPVAVSA